MKILSIDVGIKNLAFCLLNTSVDGQYEILKWDVVNVSLQQEEPHIFCDIVTKNIKCKNIAKFKKNDICYCAKHSKKTGFMFPCKTMKSSVINKKKVIELIDFIKEHKITCDTTMKKCDLLKIVNAYIADNCFEPICVNNVSASTVDLVTIGRIIKTKFNAIFKCDDIDVVIIENQISPIANRMKTIQGMISQYFIMNDDNIKIEFISSSNKLKSFTPENISATTYSERKKLGVAVCFEKLSTINKQFVDLFTNHKKKDDLADCFLQGLWYITNKLKDLKNK